MELSSCHFSDAYTFEVAARYLENLCTPVLCYFNLAVTYLVYDVLQMLSQQKDNFNNEKYFLIASQSYISSHLLFCVFHN